MAKKNAKDDETTKLKLIKTAKRLFAKYNFDYVGTRMIANEAGVGQSAIFFHFGSKENLGAAVIDDIISIHTDYYKNIILDLNKIKSEREPSPEEAFELLIRYYSSIIDIAYDKHNDTALAYMVNSKVMPPDLAKPLMERAKEDVELPTAELLCLYKGTDNIQKAFIITHSLVSSIVAYNITYNISLYDSRFNKANVKDAKKLVLGFIKTALENCVIE